MSIHHKKVEKEWKEENLPLFDQLILSWNGERPSLEIFQFEVRLKVDEWSSWLVYASWGRKEQKSYSDKTRDLKVYQDVIEVLNGKKASGFHIRIGLQNLNLHVYTRTAQTENTSTSFLNLKSISLAVKGLSQIVLNHSRCIDLCSPTSTTAVIRYLLNKTEIDPVNFALNVWDSGFDIFGNWVFNVAQASTELGPDWDCWVERLSGFNSIYQQLLQGLPVIVSVRGPLTGSAAPYAKGHLMVVRGYDSAQQKVLCMDPAFPADTLTHVAYDFEEFMQAWSRRERLAYLFQPRRAVFNSFLDE